MPKPPLKTGSAVPTWAAVVAVVAVLAAIVGFYMYSSVPHGKAPDRPSLPPGMTMGPTGPVTSTGGGPPGGIMRNPGMTGSEGRPGGPPPGMMGGPGGPMPGNDGRPGAPPGMVPGR